VGIIGVRNFSPGQHISVPVITSASNAVLRKGDERVIVRSIRGSPDGSYVGVIDGFDTSLGTEFEGLKLGDEIAFTEEHVFSLGE
jgi:hypothetical protein